MATVTISSVHKRQFGNSPYGNQSTFVFPLATLANGAVADSDSSTALAVDDVIDLGPLAEGLRLDDASVFVTTGLSASVKGSLGFVFEDGEDEPSVAQDPAYFGGNIDLATAGRTRATGRKLVILPKPARLILTIGGAANTQQSELSILVTGELVGHR
jgi:hypothetical protein